MSFTRVPPSWRLPQGVDGPLWEYTHTARLAAEEDAYFAEHPLFQADERALSTRFVKPGELIDLGCGVGRHSLRFAAQGFRVISVDLSRSMLEMVASKAAEQGVRLGTVQANLCQLGCFPDQTFDYALSMFSTLGMIRGRDQRRRALAEAQRMLRPGGQIALHVHNFWFNLRNPQGRRWLVAQVGPALLGRANQGDRQMTYRGIRGMNVHLYRWSELKREIRFAGLQISEVLPLDEVTSVTIGAPWFAHPFRAGGWIVFARKPSRLMIAVRSS